MNLLNLALTTFPDYIIVLLECRQNKKDDKPPSFYVVTNAAKERPDVWIEQPEKWVIFFTFLIIVFVNSWSLLISLSINWVAAI